MSKRILKVIFTLTLSLTILGVYAQETAGSATQTGNTTSSTVKTTSTKKAAPAKPKGPADNTLKSKYEFMSKRGGRWKEYRMIKQDWLNSYWAEVDDTLSTAYTDAIEARKETALANQEVKEMEARLGEKDRLIDLGDYITLAGMDLDKYSVVYTAFSIIVILILVLIFGLIKFKSNNQTVVEVKRDYDNVEKEYDDFRTKAQEREMKVRRELVTERNKGEEMQKELSSLRKRENKMS
ncbi:hypothetical protein [Flammeovirga pacifica]|uniref:tRNA (Guanine-N1)-methyltransferase n=1 Tax=Flammeovirga pacifica TaxID=915059 RepID=A0A1S1Z1J6_FLAPC|nr:hypothetical protein [Flammeovirga pacifica]OHX67144.1 hypothetical protein NH26_12725 [Flammeovirga pacifica]